MSSLQVKCFAIIGETITRDGIRTKTLAKKVQDQINASLDDVSPENFIDVKVYPTFGGTQDAAFVTVLYKGADKEDKKTKK